MTILRSGAQVIVQCPWPGRASCRAFRGLGEVTPAWFCVWPWPSSSASTASLLGDEIVDAIQYLGLNVREDSAPCGGRGMGSCHAAGEPDCSKVLLVVVDAGGRTTSPSNSLPTAWQTIDPSFHVVPILIGGASAAVLPPALAALNAIRWSPGDGSAVHQILRAGGLLGARPRLFISYRRHETEAIADQLFDQLNRHGFEVFLDRFGVEPGLDFQVRLTEELANMGTVLVLESRTILLSDWVRYEVDFARMHHLGLLALHLPRAPRVAGVARRRDLVAGELTRRGNEIRDSTMDGLIEWIHVAHTEAERRRISYLRDSLSDALLRSGFTSQSLVHSGIVIARKGANEYAFRVSNLPPELSDFHAVQGHRGRSRGSYVLAPAKYMDWRRRQPLDWLSRESRIELEDEGDMVSVVRRLP
jgi:AraC-like DNA-binding protein